MVQRTQRLRQSSSNGLGAVSGYVLKLSRESAGLTQAGLAEELGVDLTSVQGWESGRRPLTALRARDLSYLRHQLIGLGCPAGALNVLNEAIEADFVISEILELNPNEMRMKRHPLSTTIHRRSRINLVTWPFTGTIPDQLADVSHPRAIRRGPVADRPVMVESDKIRFFGNLRGVADRSTQPEDTLLRRQAVYLVGFDSGSESRQWLARQHEAALNDGGGQERVSNWLALRSSAIAMAQDGNPDTLHYFVSSKMSDDASQIADLNYWAYWLGEVGQPYRDDREMVYGNATSWIGDQMARHFLARLTPESTYSVLTVRSLWALLTFRSEILTRRSDLRKLAKDRVETILDGAELPSETRQELVSIAYAVRLADRR